MDYLALIDGYRDEMIKTLKELIGFKSVVGPADGDSPFGKGVQEAFDYMLDLGKVEGFKTVNIDNYGGHIEFGGELINYEDPTQKNDDIMAVLGHLDVVPAGSGWDQDAFDGQVKEGKLYGRGAIDNKGPVVAAFYALKALKEAGVQTENRVRLILGLDEEIDWTGMKYYMNKVETPAFGFTPDADFPVIHGEMGILIFELVKKIEKTKNSGVSLRSITGGNAPNMVADYCKAVFTADNYDELREKTKVFTEKTGYKLALKGRGKSLEIQSEGISAHGAHPEHGLNAISIMMAFLADVEVASDDMAEFIEFYNQKIGFELHGSAIGCGFSDEASGKLIFNVGQIDLDPEAGRLIINIRYPITMTDEQIYSALSPIITPYNFGVVKIDHKAPIYFPKDSEIVTTLMDIYRKHSGDVTSQPIVIGGGTYARSIKNAVAFGATFPGQPEVAHQKNEYIDLDAMMLSTKIFAEAIYRLAKGQTIC